MKGCRNRGGVFRSPVLRDRDRHVRSDMSHELLRILNDANESAARLLFDERVELCNGILGAH